MLNIKFLIGFIVPNTFDTCDIATNFVFSESLDENNNEIGIEGVKKLILKHQNSNLKTELQKATEEIRQKSLKKEYREKGVKENEDILDDDLTIVGIGK